MMKLKIKDFHKQGAVMAVTSTIRTFIEDNPDFMGPISLHIARVTAQEREMIEQNSADTDHYQKLIWNSIILAAISDEKVQRKALKTIEKMNQKLSAVFHIKNDSAHITIEKTA